MKDTHFFFTILFVLFLTGASSCKEVIPLNTNTYTELNTNTYTELRYEMSPPLVVMDGVVFTGKIANPQETQISHITYQKPSNLLLRMYGAGAKNGVMFITTKRTAY